MPDTATLSLFDTPKRHSGNLATSQRLQDTLRCLVPGQWVSAFKIAVTTNSLAVHSDISDLRLNGVQIEQRYNGYTENGKRISEYRLTGK
jgi:biotin operon repressor